MTKKRTRTRAPRVLKDVPVEEELVTDDEVLEEEEAPKPPTRRKRRVTKVVADEPDPERNDPDDEEEAAPKPKAKRKRVTKAKAKPTARRKRRVVDTSLEPAEEDDEEAPPVKRVRRTTKAKPKVTRTKRVTKVVADDDEESPVGQFDRAEMSGILFDLLDADLAVTLRRVANKVIVMTKAGTPIKATLESTVVDGRRKAKIPRSERAITVKEMRAYAQTEEYIEFQAWWKGMTFEEKVAEAADEDVEWEQHDDALVSNMRCTMAYMKEKGIEKWRPEYKSKNERDELLRYGLPEDQDEAD